MPSTTSKASPRGNLRRPRLVPRVVQVSELWRYPVKSMRGERLDVGRDPSRRCRGRSPGARARVVRACCHVAVPPGAARARRHVGCRRRAARRRPAVGFARGARAGAGGDGAGCRARSLRRRRPRPALRRPASDGVDGLAGSCRRVRPPALSAERADRRCAGGGGAGVGRVRAADRRGADRGAQPPLAVRHDDVRSRHAGAGPGACCCGSCMRSAAVSRSTAGSPSRASRSRRRVEVVDLQDDSPRRTAAAATRIRGSADTLPTADSSAALPMSRDSPWTCASRSCPGTVPEHAQTGHG